MRALPAFDGYTDEELEAMAKTIARIQHERRRERFERFVAENPDWKGFQ
jgi:hypothetical protein